MRFQGEGLGSGVDMPLVIGIGAACDQEAGLDGRTWDKLIGLLAPVNAHLLPAAARR